MQPHQERVIVEKRELDEKMEKLHEFLGTNKFRELPLNERELLRVQFEQMYAYSVTLGMRINNFNTESK